MMYVMINVVNNCKGEIMHQELHKARHDYLCSGCKDIIEKGTQYYKVGMFKAQVYHTECLPNAGVAPVIETKVEQVPDHSNDSFNGDRPACEEPEPEEDKEATEEENLKTLNIIAEVASRPNTNNTLPKVTKETFARSKRAKDLSTKMILNMRKGK